MAKLICLVEDSNEVMDRLVSLEEERREVEWERDADFNKAMIAFLNVQTRLTEKKTSKR